MVVGKKLILLIPELVPVDASGDRFSGAGCGWQKPGLCQGPDGQAPQQRKLPFSLRGAAPREVTQVYSFPDNVNTPSRCPLNCHFGLLSLYLCGCDVWAVCHFNFWKSHL